MNHPVPQQVCRVCGQPVTPEEGVMMGAFGRPLFVVHRHGCADMVRKAANTGTALALQGAHALLSSRAPRFYRMLTAALQAADTTLRRPQ